MKFDFGYRTGSKNEFIMTANITTLPRAEIPVVELAMVGEFCGECKGWNGGCPGCSPYFSMLKKNLPYVTVLLLSIDMAWPTMYSRGGRNDVSANFFRMGYADRLTDKFIWRVLKKIHNPKDAYILGCGHCPVCPKKKCGPIAFEKCHRPLDRRFSLEATGVDCDALVHKIEGRHLSWWFKNEVLPQDMTRVAIIVNDNPDAIESILRAQISVHPRTYPAKEIIATKLELQTGMYTAHNGMQIPIYQNLKLGYRDA
jgi:hypothetical protein